MWNVFSVNKRMTIWTYYQKIFSFIIISIFINMMKTKNLLYFIIPTFFTFIYYSSSLPESSEIIWFIWFGFIYMSHSVCTSMRTKSSWSIWRIIKFLPAFKTIIFNRMSISYVITFFRTIFGSFKTIFFYFKFLFAYLTRESHYYAFKTW